MKKRLIISLLGWLTLGCAFSASSAPIEISFEGVVNAESLFDGRTGETIDFPETQFTYQILFEELDPFYVDSSQAGSIRNHYTVYDTRLTINGTVVDTSAYYDTAFVRSTDAGSDLFFLSTSILNNDNAAPYF